MSTSCLSKVIAGCRPSIEAGMTTLHSPLVRRSAKTDASAVLECLDLKMADDQMMGLEYEYMMYNTESTDEKNEGESKG